MEEHTAMMRPSVVGPTVFMVAPGSCFGGVYVHSSKVFIEIVLHEGKVAGAEGGVNG
jgi:hypothetical protein